MLIFGTGVVTGALVMRNSDRGQGPLRPRNISQARPVGTFSPGGLRLEFLRPGQSGVGLNPGEREGIYKILKESQERAPAQVDRTKEKVQQVLKPEQKMW